MKFTRSRADLFGFLFFLAAFAFSVLVFPVSVAAQTENLSEMRAKAAALLQKDNVTDALPLLEKIAQADPEDAETQFYLGFALLAKAMNSKDKVERKQLRLRARGSFIKAKAMGKTDNIVDAFIGSIPADGSESKGFSENEQANSLMEAGEKAFTSGKIDDALAAYQKALQLDPKIYEAALFSGDMYLKKNDFPNAEIWYQKAIAIDPNRETAYRYSATPLMRQGKTAQARPLRRSVYFRALQPFRSQRNAAMGRSDEHEYVASARRSSRIENRRGRKNYRDNQRQPARRRRLDGLDRIHGDANRMARKEIRQNISSRKNLSPHFAGRSRSAAQRRQNGERTERKNENS